MREYFRPYNKVVTLTAGQTAYTVVELTDSAGGPLDCNYVSVTQVSGLAQGSPSMFQIVPSGVNTIYGGTSATGGGVSSRDAGPSAYPNSIARTSNEVSGSLGMVGAADGGTSIISLGPFDTTKAILMSHNGARAATYGVTYGQVTLANARADTWGINMEEVTYTSAIADFTYASGTGANTSAYTFTDTSEGNPIAWAWVFDYGGGGATSTLQNPAYDWAGVTNPIGKTVRLTITTLHSAGQGTANIEDKVLA